MSPIPMGTGTSQVLLLWFLGLLFTIGDITMIVGSMEDTGDTTDEAYSRLYFPLLHGYYGRAARWIPDLFRVWGSKPECSL